METAEPVTYKFSGQGVGTIVPHCILGFPGKPNFLFSNPATADTPDSFLYSLSGPAFSDFGHHDPPQTHHCQSLPPSPSPSTSHANDHYVHQAQISASTPKPFQQQPYAGSSHFQHQKPLYAQQIQLSSEPFLFEGITDSCPAKNDTSHASKETLAKHIPGSGAASSASRNRREAGRAQGKTVDDVDFSTEVDMLMEAIQSHAESGLSGMQTQQSQLTQGSAKLHWPVYPMTYDSVIPTASSAPVVPTTSLAATSLRLKSIMVGEEPGSRLRKKRKYACTLPHCGKNFAQRAHLDTHIRTHTGDKPFVRLHLF